jgi:hypothetical protein
MDFQKVSIIVAALLLAIILGTLAYTISNTKSNGNIPWPPVLGVCPDYWEDLSGNGSQCVGVFNGSTGNNTGNILQSGTSGFSAPIDFSNMTTKQNPGSGIPFLTQVTNPTYSGSDPICAQRMWGQQHKNISWDGITYGISQPSGCTV